MKLKKIMAPVLAATMMTSALAGCAGKSTTEPTTASAAQETAKTAEQSTAETAAPENLASNGLPLDYYAGTELTIYTKPGSTTDTSIRDDKLIYQLAEEATGIHINWVNLSTEAWSEQVNLLLSGGDLPDAFLGSISESTVSANLDMFYDLSEEGLLETYAPDVLATIEEVYPNGINAIVWPDGSIRALPTGRAETDYSEPTWFMMINTRWLENVGKEMPTTTEELYDVLCAFRDMDANGNGDATDEIPFGFADKYGTAHIHQTVNFFGIANAKDGDTGHYKMVKDGVVTPTADTDEWRAWLEYMNLLYSEGLLDAEGFSQTGDEYSSKLSQDLYGVAFMFSPTHVGLNFDDWEILWVQGMDGIEPIIDGNKEYDTTARIGLTISADCEHVDALLHWWNYMSSSRELKMTAFAGDQGVLWDIYDGEIYLNDDWKKEAQYEGETASTLTYKLGNAGFSVLLSVADYAEDDRYTHIVDGVPTKLEFNPADSTSSRLKLVAQIYDWLQDEYIPKNYVAADKTDERTMIETDLFPMMANFLSTSIVSGVTDASWDAYLKDLQSYGYYNWIEWYQKQLDGEY